MSVLPVPAGDMSKVSQFHCFFLPTAAGFQESGVPLVLSCLVDGSTSETTTSTPFNEAQTRETFFLDSGQLLSLTERTETAGADDNGGGGSPEFRQATAIDNGASLLADVMEELGYACTAS